MNYKDVEEPEHKDEDQSFENNKAKEISQEGNRQEENAKKFTKTIARK